MPAKKQKYLDYKIKISKQPLQKYYFAVDMEVITPASARKVKIGSHVWNHLSDDALRWVIENEKKHSSSVMLTEEQWNDLDMQSTPAAPPATQPSRRGISKNSKMATKPAAKQQKQQNKKRQQQDTETSDSMSNDEHSEDEIPVAKPKKTRKPTAAAKSTASAATTVSANTKTSKQTKSRGKGKRGGKQSQSEPDETLDEQPVVDQLDEPAADTQPVPQSVDDDSMSDDEEDESLDESLMQPLEEADVEQTRQLFKEWLCYFAGASVNGNHPVRLPIEIVKKLIRYVRFQKMHKGNISEICKEFDIEGGDCTLEHLFEMGVFLWTRLDEYSIPEPLLLQYMFRNGLQIDVDKVHQRFQERQEETYSMSETAYGRYQNLYDDFIEKGDNVKTNPSVNDIKTCKIINSISDESIHKNSYSYKDAIFRLKAAVYAKLYADGVVKPSNMSAVLPEYSDPDDEKDEPMADTGDDQEKEQESAEKGAVGNESVEVASSEIKEKAVTTVAMEDDTEQQLDFWTMDVDDLTTKSRR